MKRRHDDRNHQKAMKLSIASKHSSAPVGERNLGIRRVGHRRSAGKYFPLSFRRKKSMPPQDTRPTKSLPPRPTKSEESIPPCTPVVRGATPASPLLWGFQGTLLHCLFHSRPSVAKWGVQGHTGIYSPTEPKLLSLSRCPSAML